MEKMDHRNRQFGIQFLEMASFFCHFSLFLLFDYNVIIVNVFNIRRSQRSGNKWRANSH